MADLQKSLDKLKLKIEGGMAPESVAIMHQATKDLEASGVVNGILKVGDKAPEFILKNHKGVTIISEELLKKGPILITFYRGLWCPYCNKDLAYLKRFKEQLEAKGVTLLSISPQLEENNNKIVEQQRLNYDLLTDNGNNIASAFGLRWTMIDPLKSLYDSFGINLPKYNGDTSWTLPIPARFIIGENGIIKYAEFSVDYTKRPNPDVLLDIL
ncbi:Peroxiredoxin [Tenacibaculum sp. 190130A14a]|uniref:thioredoxin-dependent peroxiredoxin n=1 Tax=Tenacibaculum polynesiense TaxID=3137857 RepID=A0ABP1EZP3_9FLAO